MSEQDAPGDDRDAKTMGEQSNSKQIQADILRFALTDPDAAVLDMQAFADEYGYDYQRVRSEVDDLYPLLEYGAGAGAPWIGFKQLPAIKQRLEKLS